MASKTSYINWVSLGIEETVWVTLAFSCCFMTYDFFTVTSSQPLAFSFEELVIVILALFCNIVLLLALEKL